MEVLNNNDTIWHHCHWSPAWPGFSWMVAMMMRSEWVSDGRWWVARGIPAWSDQHSFSVMMSVWKWAFNFNESVSFIFNGQFVGQFVGDILRDKVHVCLSCRCLVMISPCVCLASLLTLSQAPLSQSPNIKLWSLSGSASHVKIWRMI